VLFLGAGVGIPAGLPNWQELLEELAEDAELEPREIKALGALDALDAARILEARLGGRGEQLGAAIARHVHAERFGLGHALLADLPVTEVVTTNYDTLFERALEAAGRRFAVLPYDAPRRDDDGWLLKLHGCVERGLHDIVLTRGDYFRYADRRAALAGIVQALLITRSMLFTGFSLRDENFLRIADDVRKAVQGESGSAAPYFGTALLLGDEPLLRELWADELECVAVGSDDRDGRSLDLFLDQMLAAASTGAEHLLDDTFIGALDTGETQLRDALRTFERQLPEAARATPAWAVVQAALSRLGRRP
jgi:hypothetical protein